MDDPVSIGLFITLVILIVLSGFFSASETAYTSLNEVRLRRFAETHKSAKTALKLLDKYEKLISTILVGNNIVNIVATSVSSVIFIAFFGEALGVTLSTVILTVVVLVFGEITPKTVAKEIPEKTAMAVAYPLTFLFYLLTPFNIVFNGIAVGIKKIFHVNGKNQGYTEEEFKMLVTDITNDGVLEQQEHDYIQNTIVCDDRTVDAVMTKMEDVEYVKSSEKIENIIDSFKTYNYSRLPVKREEKIIGILYQKDFYEMLLDGERDWKELIKPVRYVYTDMKIFKLLKVMQKRHQHMAVVVDEDKLPLGIITLEDIMEEVVGEIEDEYDDEREEADLLEELEEEKKKMAQKI